MDRAQNSGSRYLGGALSPGPEWEGLIGKSMNFAFTTDNVVRTYQDLVAKGVAFEGPPEQMPWGTFAILKDPDGTKIALSSNQRTKD